LSEDFIFIDEQVFDALSGDLIHTIRQSLICDEDSKQWLLKAGRFRVYDVSDSVMVASTELVTSHQSSICTVQLNPASLMRVEQGEELITILSDDLDENSLVLPPPIRSPLIDSTLPNSIERTPIPISHPSPHIGHQQFLSIVDSLKRLRATKGVRNAFKSLVYDILDIQRLHISNLEGNGKQSFSTCISLIEGFIFLRLKICMETTLENFTRKTYYDYFPVYDITLICSLFVTILYFNYMLYRKKNI
jgi:hypothetical protein